ncbi:MAG: tyrosine recombinase XerD [Deltaproteobacteria bacterium]|jgi:integrase/recombinase XerD|nr:tyrosine recombinase XerD [Deltaproteobacteria bacterium]
MAREGAGSVAEGWEALRDLYLGHLRVERGLSPHTISGYARDLADLAAFFAGKGIDAPARAGRGEIQGFVLHLAAERGLSARSRARKLSAVKGFFAFLENEGLAERDCAAGVEGPRLPRPLPKALTRREAELLVTSPDLSRPGGLRDRAMFELLYAGGLRVSELAGLTLGQLNLPESFLRVRGKGSKDRLVPVGDEAARWLARYMAEERPRLDRTGKASCLFLNARGGPLSRQYLWRLVSRHSALAGIRHASPHVIRHSFATHLVEGGADLRSVQAMLGHAGLGTTEVYLRAADSRLKSVHSRRHPRSGR